jgi:hypothetical protein
MLTHGHQRKDYIDNPFLRWNENLDDYPDFHGDIDDHSLYETDNFERDKMFKAKESNVVGNTTVIPMDDNDGHL